MAYKDFKVTIPVEPFIHSYLIKNYGSGYRPQSTDLLGGIVICSMMLVGNDHGYIKNDDKEYEVFVTRMFYRKFLDMDTKERLGIYGVSDNGIFFFNKMIGKIMREQLFMEMLFNKNRTQTKYNDTIRDFCARYGIGEDDISMESLQQEFKRYQKNLKKEVCSPICAT